MTEARPPIWRWLRYAFGGVLPARYADWVWDDLTGPDWRMREAGRILLFAVIPVVVIMFLPGRIDLRIFMALIVLIGPGFIGLAYGDELRDARLRQHGLKPPMGPDPD